MDDRGLIGDSYIKNQKFIRDDQEFQKLRDDAKSLGLMDLKEKVEKLELSFEDVQFHVEHGFLKPELIEEAREDYIDGRELKSEAKFKLPNMRKLLTSERHPDKKTFHFLNVVLGPLNYQPNPRNFKNKKEKPAKIIESHPKTIDVIDILLNAWSEKINLSREDILYELIFDNIQLNTHLQYVLDNVLEKDDFEGKIILITSAIKSGEITFPNFSEEVSDA